jgi:hypothetical protein
MDSRAIKKLVLKDIVKMFPNMNNGQIQQMESIYAYSPKSAIRYCQVIQDYINRKRNGRNNVNRALSMETRDNSHHN